MTPLSWTKELELWEKGHSVIGLDEVGRGALAGPVVVGAVLFAPDVQLNVDKFSDLQESKKTRPTKRIKLDELIHKFATGVAVGESPNSRIDEVGIVRATHEAALNAITKLSLATDTKVTVLTDYRLLSKHLSFPYPYEEYIDGDAQIPIIAAASIIAKVWRDQYMQNLAAEIDPDDRYYLRSNVGYGAVKHLQALRSYGSTPIHRQTFLTKLNDEINVPTPTL